MENVTWMNITLQSDDHGFTNTGINIPGVISVAVFYALIFIVGLYASWRGKKQSENQTSEDVMLAGRDIGVVVGFFTMTATWVGGAFINGTAEKIYSKGLLWTQAPICYSLSLLVGGVVFAKKMRAAGYVTMLDPFEMKYGKVMGGLLYIPALLGETFWSAAVLSALGSTLAVILGLDHKTSVIISAGIAVFYTVVGGLYSVAYTDVIQLICICIGLWLGVIFSLMNPHVGKLGETVLDPDSSWLGTIPSGPILGYYIDTTILLILGGIPWQAYFQRVLSISTPNKALFTSACASIGCLVLSVPPVLIGITARATYWNETEYADYGPLPMEKKQYKLILPMVLKYLTPLPVALIGLGAVSAAVMSSADSSILSTSSMFAKNVYKPLRETCACGKEASDREILWVMRVATILIGVYASVIAIIVNSVYGLLTMCSDLCYVVLFPQLLLVNYFKYSNTWGSMAGFLVGFFLRLSAGEPLIGFPPLLKWPGYDAKLGQMFPHKTVTMLISLVTIIFISLLARRFCNTGSDEDLELTYVAMQKEVTEDKMKDNSNKSQEVYKAQSA